MAAQEAGDQAGQMAGRAQDQAQQMGGKAREMGGQARKKGQGVFQKLSCAKCDVKSMAIHMANLVVPHLCVFVFYMDLCFCIPYALIELIDKKMEEHCDYCLLCDNKIYDNYNAWSHKVFHDCD